MRLTLINDGLESSCSCSGLKTSSQWWRLVLIWICNWLSCRLGVWFLGLFLLIAHIIIECTIHTLHANKVLLAIYLIDRLRLVITNSWLQLLTRWGLWNLSWVDFTTILATLGPIVNNIDLIANNDRSMRVIVCIINWIWERRVSIASSLLTLLANSVFRCCLNCLMICCSWTKYLLIVHRWMFNCLMPLLQVVELLILSI